MLPLTASEADRVAAAVVADRLDDLDGDVLVRSGLAARAYLAAGAGAERTEAVRAFADMMMHHRTVRRELRPLLDAWRVEGIRVLVFKGFHLAEWVYDHPAERLYGDVDLLIAPADVSRAAAVALRAGWAMPWSRRPSPPPRRPYAHGAFKHEELHLVSPSGVAQLDVHRFIAHCASPFVAVQRRLTAAAWADAREARLDGVPVLVPRAEDAVLFGLVLNRLWSPDVLTPKPHDYFDLRTTARRYTLSPETLARRAHELGCLSTWRLFLSRCDPWRRRLTLVRPGLLRRHAYLALVATERPHPQVEDLAMRAYDAVVSRR